MQSLKPSTALPYYLALFINIYVKGWHIILEQNGKFSSGNLSFEVKGSFKLIGAFPFLFEFFFGVLQRFIPYVCDHFQCRIDGHDWAFIIIEPNLGFVIKIFYRLFNFFGSYQLIRIKLNGIIFHDGVRQ